MSLSSRSNAEHTVEFTPPMINGVSASKVFLPRLQLQPVSLLAFLTEHFPHIEQQEWIQRFDDGLILDNAGQVLDKSQAYIGNQHIYYYRFLAHEIHIPFQEKILFENEDLLIVDKPHFLTMSPTGQYVQETLLVRLKNTTQIQDLTPIHRLDRETAGVVMFSKRAQSRGLYQQMFADRQVKKIYHAVAPYDSHLNFPQQVNLRIEKGEPFFTMQIVEGFPNSQTEIRLLNHNQHWAVYELHPHTGKQHQLRVHLNYLGIAIKNDPFYPTVQHKKADDFSQPLQLLAKQIEFKDPITMENMTFCSHLELSLPSSCNDK